MYHKTYPIKDFHASSYGLSLYERVMDAVVVVDDSAQNSVNVATKNRKPLLWRQQRWQLRNRQRR